ncbi:MAG: hypothetical protein WC623_22475 [Pedobacter sp.]|uniref:hypothetical protein n=1 Tax=Pedobacter sp. TaxID=1411316 RepID=UPI0035673F32
MTKTVVEKAYNKLAVHAKKHAKLQKNFDEACREQYGFIFQECDFSIDPIRPQMSFCDSDPIIDTIDYGTDCLPFNEFDIMMRKAMKIKETMEGK